MSSRPVSRGGGSKSNLLIEKSRLSRRSHALQSRRGGAIILTVVRFALIPSRKARHATARRGAPAAQATSTGRRQFAEAEAAASGECSEPRRRRRRDRSRSLDVPPQSGSRRRDDGAGRGLDVPAERQGGRVARGVEEARARARFRRPEPAGADHFRPGEHGAPRGLLSPTWPVPRRGRADRPVAGQPAIAVREDRAWPRARTSGGGRSRRRELDGRDGARASGVRRAVPRDDDRGRDPRRRSRNAQANVGRSGGPPKAVSAGAIGHDPARVDAAGGVRDRYAFVGVHPAGHGGIHQGPERGQRGGHTSGNHAGADGVQRVHGLGRLVRGASGGGGGRFSGSSGSTNGRAARRFWTRS